MKKSPKKITDDEIRKLVIERLKTFPLGKKVSIGSEGSFDKEELINHIEKQDKVGEKIVEIQLSYLQALKEGELLSE